MKHEIKHEMQHGLDMVDMGDRRIGTTRTAHGMHALGLVKSQG